MEFTSGHLTYQPPLSQVVCLEGENLCILPGSPTGEAFNPPEIYDGF